MTPRASPLVLAAPSGTGKTTLARRLVEDSPHYVFSVSVTTRDARPGERDGVDYHFVDPPGFEAMALAGQLAEWAEVHGRLYGTPRAELEAAADRGEHVVLDIDVQGARQLKKSVPDTKLVFVLPPNIDTLMSRLTGRGTEDSANVARRLTSALAELQAVEDFDYVVVNDDLERCLETIRAIAEGERSAAPPGVVEHDVEAFRQEVRRVLEERYAEYKDNPKVEERS